MIKKKVPFAVPFKIHKSEFHLTYTDPSKLENNKPLRISSCAKRIFFRLGQF